MKSRTGTVKRPRQYVQGARAEAAEETGRRIVEVFLACLMDAWFDEITLDDVAVKAGVTVQTVVRRFGGKEGLLAAALPMIGEQVRTTREAPSGDVDRIVDKLLLDYERTGDPVLRLLALEQRHLWLKKFMDHGRAQHRDWVAAAFAGTLERLQGQQRRRMEDALVILTDAYTWKLLRRDMGRSVAESAEILTAMIKRVISGSEQPTA